MREDALTVKVVTTVNGSHIEPPLDESASQFDQLRWRVAVLHANTGGAWPVSVEEYPSNFCVMVGNTAHACGFEWAWSLLNGIEVGLRLAAVGPLL